MIDIAILDQVFLSDTKHIAVGESLKGEDWLEVFAYPENKYGFIANVQIQKDDILMLVHYMTIRGFQPTHIPRYGPDGKIALPTVYNFMYSMPDAEWWTHFSENFQVVEK